MRHPSIIKIHSATLQLFEHTVLSRFYLHCNHRLPSVCFSEKSYYDLGIYKAAYGSILYFIRQGRCLIDDVLRYKTLCIHV